MTPRTLRNYIYGKKVFVLRIAASYLVCATITLTRWMLICFEASLICSFIRSLPPYYINPSGRRAFVVALLPSVHTYFVSFLLKRKVPMHKRNESVKCNIIVQTEIIKKYVSSEK